MLVNLHVKNIAIIDEEEIDFSDGLNILSGETGAGKSIILGALGLAMGGKAPKGLIRDESKEALAEAVFSVNPIQKEKLLSMDIECPDDEIILQRRITPQRAAAKINGENVPADRLAKAASVLVDIYGQHEQASLLSKKNHIRLLDEYASQDISELKPELAKSYATYNEIRQELSTMEGDEGERAREADLLAHEINRIEAAGLLPGEDDSLREEYKKLIKGEKIIRAVSAAFDLCDEGALPKLAEAIRQLREIHTDDEQIEGFIQALSDADGIISDVNMSLKAYEESFDLSPERMEFVSGRIDEIDSLKRMFSKNGTIEEVLTSLEEKRERLAKLTDFEAWQKKLSDRLEAERQGLMALCGRLTVIRTEYAKRLSGLLTDALADLNFTGAQVELRVESLSEPTSNGMDDVSFFIATNPGESKRPLNEIASGGELSRIMLAIKTIFAQSTDIDTLIFDEIDSGVSGKTAAKVAGRLAGLSGSSQVICITHLPQIAAKAKHHFLIEKRTEESKTVSSIRPLNKDERVNEIARMLAGDDINEAAVENARALLSFSGDNT